MGGLPFILSPLAQLMGAGSQVCCLLSLTVLWDHGQEPWCPSTQRLGSTHGSLVANATCCWCVPQHRPCSWDPTSAAGWLSSEHVGSIPSPPWQCLPTGAVQELSLSLRARGTQGIRLLLQEQALGLCWTTSPCEQMGMAPAAQEGHQVPESLARRTIGSTGSHTQALPVLRGPPAPLTGMLRHPLIHELRFLAVCVTSVCI